MEKANRRRRFTINFKLHCIRQVELTSSIRQTAKANGMSRATLRNWVKNKSLLENVVNRSKNICLTFLSLPKINAYFVYLLLGVRSNRQTTRKGAHPRLEKRLFNHIRKKRRSGACIGQKYIRMKAMKIAMQQKLERFCGKQFFNFKNGTIIF